MIEAEEAVRRFQEGDPEAFADLVRHWEGRVFNFALRYLGSPQDAQDAMQETFLSVFRAIGSLRDSRSFPAWMFRILLNHCRARWRTRPPEVSLDESFDEGGEADETRLSMPPETRDSLSETVTRDLLRRALLDVGEDQRTAILLKEYLGLSLEEVAAAMECPLSTAKSRLYHGLRGMQRSLERLGVRSSGKK